jgi:hypothetical protein
MIWTTYSAVGIRFNVVPEQMVEKIRQQQKEIEYLKRQRASNGDDFAFDQPAYGLANRFERTVAGPIIQHPPRFCYAAIRAVSDMIPGG